MECKAAPPTSPPPPPAATAALISSVLGDDDLLREILLRLGFPTSLVRAALVSKRWLRHASDPAFLRRFRDLHPPRLLGFYLDVLPLFVPLSQPPELAAVLRRAGLQPGSDSGFALISDCRNGRLLAWVDFSLGLQVCTPLDPARDPPTLPPCPDDGGNGVQEVYMVLPEDGGDVMSYIEISLIGEDRVIFAKAVSIKAGFLDFADVRTSASIELPTKLAILMKRSLLIHGDFYMLGEKKHILRLNLASMSLSLIKLPHGVEQLKRLGNLELLRADDSGFYLIHLKGFEIHVWLHGADGNWALVDTICLRQSFGQVAEPNWESGDPFLGDVFVAMHRIEDNAELLLQVNRVVFRIHIGNRTADKVFEMAPEDSIFFRIYPLMMLWPPTFPALDYDHEQHD